MVKNVIKVYARLKKQTPDKQVKKEKYIISRSVSEYEDLIIPHSSSDPSRCSYHQFRYHKVFDQNSSQDEVFNMVAKPVVSSVMHGFNGTVFAYGQTGSGKTYSITGCPKNYNNRGIIPRCIEYIFEYLNKNPDVYSVHLSYLEIYNEIGYDLLSPKQTAHKLEEFPRVLMLEDAKGEAHLRNLSIHPVFTVKEAMRFLFLGDTNRTIAETPTNEYSSRSHCIFTIYLSNSTNSNGKQVKSKLHIVDLAGSERVHKSNITGTILNEAKNINLSLHYLEHVILALSSRKGHIPFRNSMLTYLLRDSLCGNSLTTMLATLTISGKTMEETLSTCRFSRRVSMISTECTINEEEFNSQQEIYMLQKEISDLKSKLMKYESTSLKKSCDDRHLAEVEMVINNKEKYCEKIVEEFMIYNADLAKLTTMEMKSCLEIMREAYFNKRNKDENKLEAQVRDLEDKLRQKDEEIVILKKAIDHSNDKNREALSTGSFFKSTQKTAHSNATHHNTGSIVKSPRQRYENDIKEYNRKLDQKYEEAKAIAEIIERCKNNIINIRTRLENCCTNEVRNRINEELCHEQNVYRESIVTLREIEKETNHLKLGLLQVEVKMGRRDSDQRRPATTVEFSSGSPRNESIIHTEKNNEMTNPQKLFERSTFQSLSSTAGSARSDILGKSDGDEFVIKNYNQPEREVDDTFSSAQTSSIIPNPSAYAYKDLHGTSKSFLEMLIDNEDLLANELLPEHLRKPLVDNISRGNAQYVQGSSLFEDELLERQFTQSYLPYNPTNFHGDLENISSNYEKRTDRNILSPVDEDYSRGENITQGGVRETSNDTFKSKSQTNFEFHKDTDSKEFKEFIKSIPLTGDREVDEEIFNFYRSKFRNKI